MTDYTINGLLVSWGRSVRRQFRQHEYPSASPGAWMTNRYGEDKSARATGLYTGAVKRIRRVEAGMVEGRPQMRRERVRVMAPQATQSQTRVYRAPDVPELSRRMCLVSEVVKALGEPHADVLELRYVWEASQKEGARHFGVAVRTWARMLRRASDRFEESWQRGEVREAS